MLSKYRRARRASSTENCSSSVAYQCIYKNSRHLPFYASQDAHGHRGALYLRRFAGMLKITTKEGAASLTFVLEGRLCRPWIAEAECGWTNLISTAGDKQVVLDLAGLTFVDGDGEALLSSMLESGTQVRARGVLVSHLVAQVQKRMQRKSKQFSRSAPGPRRDPGAP